MIYLSSISKAFETPGHPSNVVFAPSSLTLPPQRKIAILGGHLSGKSVLLRIVAGVDAPDRGRIISRLRCSPIANTGALFSLRMTILDNIRYAARTYGVQTDTLVLAVASYAEWTYSSLNKPLGSIPSTARRMLDTALIAVLPFDCYLIDHMSNLGQSLTERFLGSAVSRNAGVIFTTSRLHDLRLYADFVVVIRNHTLYPFDCVNEAIQFYERQAT